MEEEQERGLRQGCCLVGEAELASRGSFILVQLGAGSSQCGCALQ